MKQLAEALMQLLKQLKQLILSQSNFVGLQPKVQRMAEEVIAEMFNQGFAVMVYQGYRSIADQNYLYQQGRTRIGQKVTNARGGQSYHNFGVAVDIVFMVDGKPSWDDSHPWHLLGEVGESAGFEWGGRWSGFVDLPHFQYTEGYGHKEFLTNKVDVSKFV